MATARRGIALLSFICFISVLASADSVSNIPITGTASQGFGQTIGDYTITGPGLFLNQGMPGGHNTIGSCTVGTACDFSFSVGSPNTFCFQCPYYSFGRVGNKVADFVDASSLLFTGSAFFPGGDDIAQGINLPVTVTGTITGYRLVDCLAPGVGSCNLGPKLFTVRIIGNGTGHFVLQNTGGAIRNVYGGFANFTGTATVILIPEPMSLALTGTGLLGIWIRRKIAQSKQD